MSSAATREVGLRPVQIPAGVVLHGELGVPEAPDGLIIFAHGSGGGRMSPRNRKVAARLSEEGFATLVLDLLTADEEAFDVFGGKTRFDVELLADRLVSATRWVRAYPDLARLPIGYFAGSTGAAAALIAAARHPEGLKAVVSRGGRPDLASKYLPAVDVPTLLIVGSLDTRVLAFNREAIEWIGTPVKQLTVVAGASHLFEEAGTLGQVIGHAEDWFRSYLRTPDVEGVEIC